MKNETSKMSMNPKSMTTSKMNPTPKKAHSQNFDGRQNFMKHNTNFGARQSEVEDDI